MKIIKNGKHEYEKNNVNEASGYIKWFNDVEATFIRIGGVVLSCISLFAFLYISPKDTLEKNFGVPKGTFEIASFFWGGVLLMIFIVPLLWKIFQLVIASNGKPDEKCILKLKGKLTCIYNEKLTRERALACLIVPGVVFVLIFSVLTVLTDGVQKTFFVLMLYRTILYLTDDIGAIWSLMRYTEKNDIIFGEYRKSQTTHIN